MRRSSVAAALRWIAVLVLLAAAGRAVPRVSAQESNVLPKLPGTAWHTRDAGALFFVLSGIGVRFGDDGTFVATVRFVDDQKERKTGTYRFEGEGYLSLDIEGYAKQRVRVWTDGKDIMVRDEAHDITARLVPGARNDTSWV